MSFSRQDYDHILALLQSLSEEKYKAFNESLIPGTKTAYGVRVPKMREIAKSVVKKDAVGFLALSRPASYEETLLRGMVIATMKTDISTRLSLVADFLPLIDNWAVCDSFCASFTLKKPEEKAAVWQFISPLFTDNREFFARFALVMGLDYFITEEYITPLLSYISSAACPAYYVQMAAAWAVSVCYVKFPRETLSLIKSRTLSPFVQNKGIQKIRESFRVSREDKDMLLQYKV